MCILGSENTHYIIVKVSTSGKRRISLNLNSFRLAIFNQFFRIAKRMTFDLVDSRYNTGNFLKLFQMMNLEIADADGKYTAGFKKFGHLQPGSGIAARHRPVNQIKIQVIQLQPLHASIKSPIYISKALRVIPDFAGDKKFLAWDTTFGNCLAYTFFVFVSGSSVNKTVARVHCSCNGCLCFVICCFIYTKP